MNPLTLPVWARWWSGDALYRFVCDLISDELTRLRPFSLLPPRPWPSDLDLTGQELACDSLELTSLATALAEAVQMHQTGVEDYLLARRRIGDWVEIAETSLDRYAQQIVFRTSGSGGHPKSWPHELKNLVQEVDVLADIFSDRRRIISCVPSHHIYGFLFSILLANRLELPAYDGRGRLPSSVAGIIEDGDLIIGQPVFWSAFALGGVITADVIGTTSTAPCSDDLARAVLNAGVRQLVQVYGSTETAGIGVRTSADTDYQLLPHWSRCSCADGLSRTEADGREAFHVPPDLLEWSSAQTFRVVRRRDAAVQVGGHNVYPAHVAARLCQHPAVDQATVRLMSLDEGVRLKAFVVPRHGADDHEQLRLELRTWCDRELQAPERPKAFSFGRSLPVNDRGKLTDWLVED